MMKQSGCIENCYLLCKCKCTRLTQYLVFLKQAFWHDRGGGESILGQHDLIYAERIKENGYTKKGYNQGPIL